METIYISIVIFIWIGFLYFRYGLICLKLDNVLNEKET